MKRTKHTLLFSTIALVFIMVIFSTISWQILNRSFRSEINTQLKNLSIKNAGLVKTKLQDNLSSLRLLATSLEDSSINIADYITTDLGFIATNNGYLRLGITTSDGICHRSDGIETNVRDYVFFQEGIKGNESISTIYGETDHEGLLMFAVPIMKNGEVVAILDSVQTTKVISESLIDNVIFEGSFYMIADASGNVILAQLNNVASFKTFLQQNYDSIISSQENQNFTFEGNNYIASSSDVEINGWKSVSFIPSSVISAKTSEFNDRLIMFYVIITLILLAIIIYIYWLRKKQSEMKVKLFQNHLLGIENNVWFEEQVQLYVQKNQNTYILAIFDIVDFRLLNLQFGFEKGDEVLGAYMQYIHHKFDNKLIGAHLEKDKYIMLLPSNDDDMQQKLFTFTQDLKKEIETLCNLKDISFCIGMHIWDTTQESLLSAIDKAEYSIIEENNQFIHIYNKQMETKRLYDKKLEGMMEQALINHEFVVYYQPKVHQSDGKIDSAEALVRWISASEGIIYPNDFIPLFEKNGFLEVLDFYVYEEVCKFIAENRTQHRDIHISFNVSITYIFHGGFAKRLRMMANAYNVPCSCIEIEILETAIASNVKQMVAFLQELHSYGFRVAMDDFGSGYSSLNQLKNFPVDTLKIDKDFFVKQDVDSANQKGNTIVELIMNMAKQMNLTTVVEGVETQETLDFIRKCGCDYVQGYYYYKPMPVEDFRIVLDEQANKK